jgi:hypothetical protein
LYVFLAACLSNTSPAIAASSTNSPLSDRALPLSRNFTEAIVETPSCRVTGERIRECGGVSDKVRMIESE